MGQSVTVVAKPSSNPEVLRFEINRSLTGMGHERYRSLDDVVHDRPVDRLAAKLLAAGGVDAVHVNSSVITVDLAGGSTGDGLEEIIVNMFRFYGQDEPEPEDDPAEPDPAEDETAEDEPDAVDGETAETADGETANDEPADG